jgi:hypothetical protein
MNVKRGYFVKEEDKQEIFFRNEVSGGIRILEKRDVNI